MARPVLVQTGQTPILAGTGEFDILCRSCSTILARRIEEDSLLAVDLECGKCTSVTRTPPWSRTSPLPTSTLTLGRTGRLLVSDTIEVPSAVCISCDAEVARVGSAMGSRPPPTDPIDVSSAGLKLFVMHLDLLSGSALSRALGSARSAARSGNRNHMKIPLAWAISHLERRIGGEPVNEYDVGAFAYYTNAVHLMARWKHHPLFHVFVRGLIDEFHHTITMLLAASYLEDKGNKIGFTDARRESGRSSDLFVAVTRDAKSYIEVKAPGNIQWPQSVSDRRLSENLVSQFKSAKKQLGERGGVIVIGASAKNAQEPLLAAIRKLVSQNKVSSKIDVIAAITYTPSISFRTDKNLECTSVVNIRPVRNSRFLGTSRVVIG